MTCPACGSSMRSNGKRDQGGIVYRFWHCDNCGHDEMTIERPNMIDGGQLP